MLLVVLVQSCVTNKELIKLKKETKLIVFDLDGTISNVTKIQLETWQKLLGKTKSYYKRFMGPPKSVMLKNMNQNYTSSQIKNICKNWDVMYIAKVRNKNVISKKTVETLKLLNKKYFIGIITSGEKQIADAALKKHNKLFNFILTAEDYSKPKPNPLSLLKVMKKYKLNGNEVIFVGDNINDILFGKNAKTKTIGKIDLLYNKKQLLKYKPDAIIKNISDLKCLI